MCWPVMACVCAAVQAVGANDGLAVVSKIEAAKYGELSREEKVNALGGIAESAFEVLMRVPEKGLRASGPDIERIVAAKKWLENTNNVSAAVLAIFLQYSVDSCVLNELHRSERVRAGVSLAMPFAADSFDERLVTSILQSNAIDEAGRIDFALSFNTSVGDFCRRHAFTARDFLDGTVFDRYEKELTIGEIKIRGVHPNTGAEQEVVLVEDGTPVTVGGLGGMLMFGKIINSEEHLSKMFLPMQLEAMDIARDVRLFVSVFWKYGGLADLDEISDGNILHGKLFKDKLAKAVADDGKGHISGRNRPGGVRMIKNRDVMDRMRVSDIIGEVESRCNALYANMLALYFRFFVKSADVFPSKYRETMVYAGTGVWLGLE